MTLTTITGLLLLAMSAGLQNADPTGVRLITASETAAAFAKGRPLVETGAYKVHASRRGAAGQAEIHARDTDIFYVLEGTATIVTGGQAAGATETAPNERRGPSIAGGTPRRLTKGDVIIIPPGVPHQFTEVQSPFLYYVVKVSS